MKSYFLERVSSREKAKEVLRRILSGQEQPWLLRNGQGDVIAYFHVAEDNDSELNLPAVVVDISGRHFSCDAQVLAVLRLIQKELGGEIANDQ